MDPNTSISKMDQSYLGSVVTNEPRTNQMYRLRNLPLNESSTYTSNKNYSTNSNRPVQSQWRQPREMTNSYVINVSRGLSREEMLLIHTVASKLDPSFTITSFAGKEKSIRISLSQNIQQSVVDAISELIAGLCNLSKCNYNNTEISRSEGGVIQDPPKTKVNSEEETIQNIFSIGNNISNDQPLPNSTFTNDINSNVVSSSLPGEEIDEQVDTPGVFERPFSLKGQRHVFLYKCRYAQLKSIIDHFGCWGLRMASLEDKWACLVIYCAKDRETWGKAFQKIQKLERSQFLRKKISDSVKNVDLKRLEELTQSYGQKNACISLCVQSPSSPKNPSVSVCGLEATVELLYKIFIEYHLISEDLPEPLPSQPASTLDPNATQFPPMYHFGYKPYSPSPYSYNDIYFPMMEHPLNTSYMPTNFTTQGFNNDMRDDYNTTYNNPYFDNYPYSQIRQDNHVSSSQRPYGMSSQPFSLHDHSHDNPYYLDNEHYFSSSLYDFDTSYRKTSFTSSVADTSSDAIPTKTIPFDEKNLLSVPTSTTTTTTTTANDTSKVSTTSYKEFTPSILTNHPEKQSFSSTSLETMKSTTKLQPSSIPSESTIRKRNENENTTIPQSKLTRSSIDQSSSYSMDMSFNQEKFRNFRDDHFESFMCNFSNKPFNDDGF